MFSIQQKLLNAWLLKGLGQDPSKLYFYSIHPILSNAYQTQQFYIAHAISDYLIALVFQKNLQELVVVFY